MECWSIASCELQSLFNTPILQYSSTPDKQNPAFLIKKAGFSSTYGFTVCLAALLVLVKHLGRLSGIPCGIGKVGSHIGLLVVLN